MKTGEEQTPTPETTTDEILGDDEGLDLEAVGEAAEANADHPSEEAPNLEDIIGTEEADEVPPTDPLTAAQLETVKWKDAALRNQAELENFRKRMARERADSIKFGNSNLLSSLFPIIDNCRFGLDAARQESEKSVVFQGMSMVMKQLTDFLEGEGVKELDPAGETFDPNLHDAVGQEFSADVPEGKIITVIRRGYQLHDRLLRAANRLPPFRAGRLVELQPHIAPPVPGRG